MDAEWMLKEKLKNIANRSQDRLIMINGNSNQESPENPSFLLFIPLGLPQNTPSPARKSFPQAPVSFHHSARQQSVL